MIEYLCGRQNRYQDKVYGSRYGRQLPLVTFHCRRSAAGSEGCLGDGHACDAGVFVIQDKRYGINMVARDAVSWNVLLGLGDPA